MFALTFRLALMELRLVLATFAWTFDLEFLEANQQEPYYRDAFVTLRGPLRLRLSSRFEDK